jgi:peptidyl-tRNA hydrolase
LLGVSKAARQTGLLVAEVRDAGRSQVEAGSLTVVGLGPANNQLLDKVVGKLKLL